VKEKWRERGGGSRLGDGEARRGMKKGGSSSMARGGRGVRSRRGARGEGGNGLGATVLGGRRAHDAPGRERERRGAGRWAARGAGPSGREREKERS
jgi:hypothetical protein